MSADDRTTVNRLWRLVFLCCATVLVGCSDIASLSDAQADPQNIEQSQAMMSPGDDSQSAPTPQSDWRGKRGTCRLVVGGTSYIRGACWIRMEDEGSFQITSLDERYFAQLWRSDTEAAGYWNATPDSTHAQTPLGEMERSGACWKNARAEICAWAAR